MHCVTSVGDRSHKVRGEFREQAGHLPQFWTIPETERVIAITRLRDRNTDATRFSGKTLSGRPPMGVQGESIESPAFSPGKWLGARVTDHSRM